MPITDLLPWRRENARELAVRRREDPFLSLQEEMNRLFDDFMTDPFHTSLSGRTEWNEGMFTPRVDVSETDKEVVVNADLPGMDENDIQVSFERGVLSIYGEKHTQNEEKERRYHRIERSFGSFRRNVEMPCEVEEDKITATFKKGELEIVLPKSAEAKVSGKRITVNKG
jgi:HSP20 family protein